MEAPKGAKGEDAKATDKEKAAADEKAAAAPAKASGLKAYLPLIIAVVTMPGLAFVTTHFVLLPKLEKAVAGKVAAAPAAAGAPAGEGKGGPSAPGAEKVKVTVSLSKLLVNVAGTMGTRYLMTSVTLVGNTPDFKDKIDQNKDQLMDLATGTLSSKTISDLEKPGARNVIRAELMAVINGALGGPVVQEIYITEMAIQ